MTQKVSPAPVEPPIPGLVGDLMKNASAPSGPTNSLGASKTQEITKERNFSQLFKAKDIGDSAKKKQIMRWQNNATIKGFQESPYLLYPKYLFMQRWELVLAVAVLYTATVTPYEVAFATVGVDTPSGLTSFIVNRIVDLFFFFDLAFINFNLAYMDKSIGSGMWVVDRAKIVKRYLRGYFILDVVSTIPFGMIVLVIGDSSLEKLKLLRIIRLVRITKLLKLLQTGHVIKFLEQTGVSFNVLTLIKFVIGVLFIAHWLACGWHAVVRFENHIDNNWVNTYFSNFPGQENPTHWQIYLASYYWALVTMTTIGYGDINPTTDIERVYEIFAMLVGTSVFAYVVGSLVTIVSNMDRKSNEYHEFMDHLNEHMLEMNLSEDLKNKVRKFFTFQQSSNDMGRYRQILSQLSPAIRGDVARAHCGKWLNLIPFFHEAPIQFIQGIALRLDLETYPQSETIQVEGEQCEQMCIVQRGLVGGKGRVFNTGKVFGEILSGPGVNTYSARALTYTDVYTLSRVDLERTCQQFPVMRQRLHNMGMRRTSKNAVTDFTSAWKRYKRGLGLPTVTGADADVPFMTPAKLEMYHAEKALHNFVSHLVRLDPEAHKPALAAAARKLNLLGVDIRVADEKALRQLQPIESLASRSVMQLDIVNEKDLRTPQESRPLRSGSSPPTTPSMSLPTSPSRVKSQVELVAGQAAAENHTAVNTQLQAIFNLVRGTAVETSDLRNSLADISRRLEEVEAGVHNPRRPSLMLPDKNDRYGM